MEYKSNCINYKDPYNPLDLPPNTIRVKFKSGYTPTMGDTQTLVDSNENVWDIYKQSNDWSNLFAFETAGADVIVLEILGAETSNVTNMYKLFYFCKSLTTITLFNTSNVTNTGSMFHGCEALTSIPLYVTSKVTDMKWMFCGCKSLTSIPLFDTSKVTDISYMFRDCTNVQSGALALYQQVSTQDNPPTSYNHRDTFYNCGINTQTGSAELAQIPTSWGGTMS